MSIGEWIDATLVRAHFVLPVIGWSKESSQYDWQDRKRHRHHKKDHDRPVCGNRRTDVSRGGCCLKQHFGLRRLDGALYGDGLTPLWIARLDAAFSSGF